MPLKPSFCLRRIIMPKSYKDWLQSLGELITGVLQTEVFEATFNCKKRVYESFGFQKKLYYFETASKVMVHHTIFSNPTPIIQSSDNSQ